MAFIVKLKELKRESLLEEKRRLERIIDNIVQLNLKGSEVQKKCDLEQVANALYFIILIKYLGLEKQTLTQTNNFNVAVKIVVNNEKLFEQALETVYSQLIAIDPKEDFLERLLLLFSKMTDSKIGDKILLFKQQKAEARKEENTQSSPYLTSSDSSDNTTNIAENGNPTDNFSSDGNTSNNADNQSNHSDASNDGNYANNALSSNNFFPVSDMFVLTKKIDYREKLATLSIIKNTLGQYLHLPYAFNNHLSVLKVAFGPLIFKFIIHKSAEENGGYDIKINYKKNPHKICQFITLRVLAVVLKDAYHDENIDLLNLSFEDFCKDETLTTYHRLIHFFQAKEFLTQAHIYIARNPRSVGIRDIFSRLATFTLFKIFVDGLNNNRHFLNSYLSCEYLSIFIREIKIDNGTLQRTALIGYPQYPRVDMNNAMESAQIEMSLNALTK